jgi:hypothetical protein
VQLSRCDPDVDIWRAAQLMRRSATATRRSRKALLELEGRQRRRRHGDPAAGIADAVAQLANGTGASFLAISSFEG